MNAATQDLIPALDAGNYPRRPSRAVIIRWIKRGVIDGADGARKKLPAVKVGGVYMTTRQAIRLFSDIIRP